MLQHIHSGEQKLLDFFVPRAKGCSDSREGKHVGSRWDILSVDIQHLRLHENKARIEVCDLLMLTTHIIDSAHSKNKNK